MPIIFYIPAPTLATPPKARELPDTAEAGPLMILLPILTDPLTTLPIADKTFLPAYSSFSERSEA